MDGIEGSLSLGFFAEDETDEDVETADGEEEKGCDECEKVYVVREDGRSNSSK